MRDAFVDQTVMMGVGFGPDATTPPPIELLEPVGEVTLT